MIDEIKQCDLLCPPEGDESRQQERRATVAGQTDPQMGKLQTRLGAHEDSVTEQGHPESRTRDNAVHCRHERSVYPQELFDVVV
jgi:hypothetical protein